MVLLMVKRQHILLLLEQYDYRIHRGVAPIAREAGWQLVCPKDHVTRDRLLHNEPWDGCIAMLQRSESMEYFREHRIPLVALDFVEDDLLCPRVVPDNREIGRLAAGHFRDHGHREVFTLDPGGIAMYQERLAALKEYMEEDGGSVTVLQVSEANIAEVIGNLEVIARQRKQRLGEQPLAFFAYQDSIAAEIISICLQHELLVPEHIAVLGVDNDDLINEGLSISLSSIDIDLEGLGRRAALQLRKLLLHQSQHSGAAIVRHPPKEVVVRQSTSSYAVRNPLVSDALHWIQTHFHAGIQATDVATAMGVSQQGLQKAFASDFSRSPGQEIRHQRIQAVAHLLRSTNARLQDIAENCGYYSVDTLIISFRSAYGMTPGRYRKLNRTPATR